MRGQRIKTEYILALLALAFVGYLAYQYLAVPPAPTRVQCAPVLVNFYGLEGTEVRVPLTVKEAGTDNVVRGANIYVFSTKPYYWEREPFAMVQSMIAGQTPAIVTDSEGKGELTVKIPKEQTTNYMIITATGYWSELYNLVVGFNPAIVASSEEKCLELYPYGTVQQILRNLISLRATKIADGKSLDLRSLEVSLVGTITPVQNIVFGINANRTGATLRGASSIFVTSGERRITKIEVEVIAPNGLKAEKVKQVQLRITAGGVRLFDGLLFDEANKDLPLKDGAAGVKYTINVPNNLLIVREGQSINIEATVIADIGTDGFGAGEQILRINLVQADPLVGTPISLVIQG